MKQRRLLLFTAWSATLVLAASLSAETKAWRHASFADRVRGSLSDGGANTYIAADGGIRLINLTDLNNDGTIDLVAPTDHNYNQQVDLQICWNRAGGIGKESTQLPANGGAAFAAADLNGDGFVDLVVANR